MVEKPEVGAVVVCYFARGEQLQVASRAAEFAIVVGDRHFEEAQPVLVFGWKMSNAFCIVIIDSGAPALLGTYGEHESLAGPPVACPRQHKG